MKQSAMIEVTTSDTDERATATLAETFGFVYRCGWKTRLLLVTGTLGGIAHGLAMPIVAFFLTRTFETINNISDSAQAAAATAAPPPSADPMAQIREIAVIFLILGVYSLVSAWIETASFELMAAHATKLFQSEWFRALLRQDAAFFDIYSATTNTAPTSILKYQLGVGRRFGELIQNVVTGVAGTALALWSSWRVSLLVFAILPVLSAASLATLRRNQSKTQRANEFYQQANSTAYFTLSSLRTVLSLNGLEKMIDQYHAATQQALHSATSVLLQLGFLSGSIMGSTTCLFIGVVLFGSFVLYRDVEQTGCSPSGGAFSSNGACQNTGTDIFTAMLGIMFAGQALSQVGNCLEGLADARVAAKEGLRVMARRSGSPAKQFYKDTSSKQQDDAGSTMDFTQRDSRVDDASGTLPTIAAVLPKYQIDPFATGGIRPEKVQGMLEFRNVTFSYPCRPASPILKDFSIRIPAGKTVALVGPSGGGKSTVLSLIERFYDPLEGQVLLDGVDIKELCLTHYRKFLGYVGQEPALFATTIRENISYGAPHATQEQIETAAKMANAHDDFILSLPDQYDTHVGDKGAQLSGGQKQRIAIARVLLRQPRILCLDEATSALDAESELRVQAALDNILEEEHGSMTAVIVAHRLSTIRKADLIYVIAGGGVVESGTHEELMSKAGHYRQLVEKQEGKTTKSMEQEPGTDSWMEEEGSSEHLDMPPPKPIEDWNNPTQTLDQAPLLEFRNVQFSYPSRPNRQILKNFNLSVRAGETLALVGPSGGGKSTTVGLIERFYDPSAGVVEYQGHDIATLHPRWYRDQIGYVGQEPTLFPGTIGENIAFGALDATQEMIEEAAKQANIHDFVMSTPDKYNTSVGEAGAQLSGGQKQRVAIARALIKRPPILLLDEATSALDNDSEAIVQEALDRLMQSKDHTVIVIAHKLSTIRDCADRIAVIANGEVLELGSHDELIAKSGHYTRLVEAQKRDSSLHTLGLSKHLSSANEEEEESPEDGIDTGSSNKKKEKDADNNNAGSTISIPQRVKEMARPDLWHITIGSIGAIFTGANYPFMGLLFAQTIHLFFFRVTPCDNDDPASSVMLGFDTCEDYWDDAAAQMQSKSFEIAGYYALLTLNSLLGNMAVYWGFGHASERLSKRIRDQVFSALVRQEVAFFDVRKVGDLTTQLQENTARLHAFSGTPVRQFFLALASLLIGLFLSFLVMWPYALMGILCMVPLVFAAKLRDMKNYGTDQGNHESDAIKASSGAIMVETLLNMKTVAALGLERRRMEAYETAVAENQRFIKRESAVSGFMAGIGNFIQRWSNALLYFWGGYLLLHYPQQYLFDDFLIAQFTFLFSTLGLAAAMQDIDDRSKVEESAQWIFDILDRRSAIDPLSEKGERLDEACQSLPKVEEDDHAFDIWV